MTQSQLEAAVFFTVMSLATAAIYLLKWLFSIVREIIDEMGG